MVFWGKEKMQERRERYVGIEFYYSGLVLDNIVNHHDVDDYDLFNIVVFVWIISGDYYVSLASREREREIY